MDPGGWGTIPAALFIIIPVARAFPNAWLQPAMDIYHKIQYTSTQGGNTMKLTPLDIQQQQFRKKLANGYDRREVDMFMELVRNEMEEIITENMNIKQQLRDKTESLDAYKDREQTIKETMITTQRLKDDIHANALKEAELIIADAKIKAEEIVNGAQMRYMEIVGEIKGLKREKMQLEADLKSMLEVHLKMLDTEIIKEQKDVDDTLAVMMGKSKSSNAR